MEAQLAAITAQLSKLDKIDTIVTQLNQNVSEMKTTISEQRQKIESCTENIMNLKQVNAALQKKNTGSEIKT